MGKWQYRKPEPADVRGLCCKCGVRQQKPKANGKFQPLCRVCENELYQSEEAKRQNRKRATAYADRVRRPYRKHVADSCATCGFVPVHVCQLDVDHIDGDHGNNAPDNLQTLCANCHRLKTHEDRIKKNPQEDS